MTPRANAAAWRTPTSAEWRQRVPKALIAAAIGVIAAQYLAGFFFLWTFRLDPRSATPLTIVRYAYYYADRADIRRRLWIASGITLVAVGFAGALTLLPKRRALHGDARFARLGEIKAAGLLRAEGIILGRLGGIGPFGGRPLILGGQLGVSLAAQPRSGKGVSVVIPNLLSWSGSVVCTDIKKENWTITAGYRRVCGQQVYLFDPLARDGRTARWNPLDYVSEVPGQRISDLQLIANMFFPDPPGTDPFWAAGGRSLFLGIALYLFATPSLPRTIGEILRQGMANDEEGFAAHWKRVIQGRMSGNRPLPDTCVRALCEVIDLAPQTASSIRKTFTSRLELWANPVLDAATSASDFDLRLLRQKPISIYLGVNPKDLDRLAPLMSLFFQQAIALQTDELPEHNPALTLQVLMVLDEFPALGPIPIMTKASGFLPGYNVRTLLIMQALSQLRSVYGENGAKTLLKTLAARIFFAPKDMEEAEEISRELGFTTVKVKSVSKPTFDFSDLKGRKSRSLTISEQKRALMLPQEVKEMGSQRQLLFLENLRPVLCKKLRYYRIARFRKRLLPAPVVDEIAPVAMPPRADPLPADDLEVSGSVAPTPRARRSKRAASKSREATMQDVARIDSLTLEDFDVDWSGVQIPEKGQGERMTERELHTAVDSFLNSLRDP